MIFGLFAVEGIRLIDTMIDRQGLSDRCYQRDTFIRRTEQHVVVDVVFDDGLGITAAEFCQGVAAIEQPGIEEVGADSTRLKGELTKTEHLVLDCQLDETFLVFLHF